MANDSTEGALEGKTTGQDGHQGEFRGGASNSLHGAPSLKGPTTSYNGHTENQAPHMQTTPDIEQKWTQEPLLAHSCV